MLDELARLKSIRKLNRMVQNFRKFLQGVRVSMQQYGCAVCTSTRMSSRSAHRIGQTSCDISPCLPRTISTDQQGKQILWDSGVGRMHQTCHESYSEQVNIQNAGPFTKQNRPLLLTYIEWNTMHVSP